MQTNSASFRQVLVFTCLHPVSTHEFLIRIMSEFGSLIAILQLTWKLFIFRVKKKLTLIVVQIQAIDKKIVTKKVDDLEKKTKSIE